MNSLKMAATMALVCACHTLAHSEERVVRITIGSEQFNHQSQMRSQSFANAVDLRWQANLTKPPHPTFVVYTSEETRTLVQSKTDALAQEIAVLRSRLGQQERLIVEARDQILKRIASLPVELARDEKAYLLLQERLRRDLFDVKVP